MLCDTRLRVLQPDTYSRSPNPNRQDRKARSCVVVGYFCVTTVSIVCSIALPRAG
jgi:hypothetical protein